MAGKAKRVPVPVPGKPVRGSTTGRPLLAAMDLLGRRWALRVLWELRGGALTFRALQERCDAVSPASLNTRLAELREAGLVDVADDGYVVTAIGGELATALGPLNAWAERWARGRKR
jgi:DNA-binding HxlR family transcriptional regulator